MRKSAGSCDITTAWPKRRKGMADVSTALAAIQAIIGNSKKEWQRGFETLNADMDKRGSADMRCYKGIGCYICELCDTPEWL